MKLLKGTDPFLLILAFIGSMSYSNGAATQMMSETANPFPGGITNQSLEADAKVQKIPAAAVANYEQAVVERVNQERAIQGLPPLKRNNLLDSSADTHSDNMASRDFFAHCDLDLLTSPFDRISAAGYAWDAAAENLAAGFSSPDSVVNGWMNSPEHRANIMSTSHREIGVGYVNQQSDFSNVREDADNNCIAEDADAGPYFHYWAQNFGRRNDVYPLVINEEAAETANRDVSLYVYGVVWARDMRFRNENGSWSPWEPVATDKFWQLSPVSGTKTVEVELRNINNSVLAASDTIMLNLTCSAVDDQLDLPMQTVDYPQSFEACSLINALTGFELTEGGDVTFRAPRIHLGPGFIVRPGARFTAVSVTP